METFDSIEYPTAEEMQEMRLMFPICYQMKDSETGEYYFSYMMNLLTFYGVDPIIAIWRFKNRKHI
jgi:hypothetical protein